jgi:hypothetical protein
MFSRASGWGVGGVRGRGLLACAFGAALLVLVAQLASARPALAATCAGSTVDVVAHEDDSILFHDPELSREIAAGRCVQTVFVTAGDAGEGSSYWLGREAGARAAYAELMNVADSWTQTDAGVAGHSIPVFVSTAQPRVSLAFMRLPDGNADGSGFFSTGNRSLQKLWLGSASSLSAVDGSSTYVRSDLISVLGTLFASASADRVLTQDFVGTFGDGDHSDHHATAYFTRSASRQYATPHLLMAFQDDGIMNLPANLSSADSTAKENTFFAYAPDDLHVCQTESACQTTHYPAWWQRQYLAGAEFSDLAPGSGQPGTTVTLSGSGFTGASGVSFNGVPASFTVVSDTSITAQVPAGAVTGLVSVTTTLSTASSPRPFTVLGTAGSNVAATATVTASSENTSTGQLAVKAVDGNTDGAGTGDFTHEWATVGQKAGAWLNLQWSSPVTLDSIKLFDRPNANDQITGGTISFSDGSTLAVPSLPNDGSLVTLTFPAKNATSLRLTITTVSSTTLNIGLAEIQTFTAAPGTAPADLTMSTVTASTASIAADGADASTITVELKDSAGHDLTASGGTVALRTTNGTLSAVADNGDGTYTATLTSTAAGTATVSATLDDGSGPQPLSSEALVTITGLPPVLQSAVVNATSLTLSYDKLIDGNSVPAGSAFSVTGSSTGTQAPTRVTVSGTTVTLTLAATVVSGETIHLSYTAPGTNPLQDTGGHPAASLSGQPVTNNTTPAPSDGGGGSATTGTAASQPSTPSTPPAGPVPPAPPVTTTAAMIPGAAGSVTVGIGGATATVSWPAGTVNTDATLTVNANPNTADAVSFATGGIAVLVTVKGSNGKNVTRLGKPLDLEFHDASSSAAPAYSLNAVTWIEIPKLTSPPTLPTTWPDGWYRSGSIHILTRHATIFSLLSTRSKLVPALRLGYSVPKKLNIQLTRTLKVELRPTFPAKVTVKLLRRGTSLGAWHLRPTNSHRTFKITLPKAARKAGSYTVVLTATALGENARHSVNLKLV